MYFDFERGNNDSDAISRYEMARTQNKSVYFDVEDYERILEHYFAFRKFDILHEVLVQAISQHPTSEVVQTNHFRYLVETDQIDDAEKLMAALDTLCAKEPEYNMQKGELYLKQRKAGEAEIAFKTAYKLTKEDKASLLLDIADLFIEHGLLEKAHMYMAKARKLAPNDFEIISDLAHMYTEQHKWEDAEFLLNKLIDENPYNADFWGRIALVYEGKADIKKAIDALEYACLIDESDGFSWMNKGHLHFRLEQFDEAIRCYERYASTLSNKGLAFYFIASCYEELEDFKATESYYRQAVELVENHADSWLGLGIAYYRNGNYKDSMGCLEKAVELDDQNPDTFNFMGDCYRALGYDEESYDAYAQSIKLNPDQEDVYVTMATPIMAAGNFSMSLQVFEEGIKQYPESVTLKVYLAICLYKIGRGMEVLEVLETIPQDNTEWKEKFLQFCSSVKEDDRFKEYFND